VSTPVTIAQAYYQAMNAKDVPSLATYLHPHVVLIGPLAQLSGKEAVVEGAQKATAFFKNITIRAAFGSDTQAMLAYNWEFPAPIGTLRAAALLTIQDNLIIRIELFFDARSFEKK
jgi:hypothetical protein